MEVTSRTSRKKLHCLYSASLNICRRGNVPNPKSERRDGAVLG
jgi:hypothetical protein